MNDLCARSLIDATDQLTVAALQGNAGAGGVFLALAADQVWARDGVMLNPHYKNMGNLYGSEYWTYLLPRRVGAGAGARRSRRAGCRWARARPQACGLIDDRFGADAGGLPAPRSTRRAAGAGGGPRTSRSGSRPSAQRRAADEAHKPLAAYRAEELAHMQRNFYGFDPSYHVARYHFVAQAAALVDAAAPGAAPASRRPTAARGVTEAPQHRPSQDLSAGRRQRDRRRMR